MSDELLVRVDQALCTGDGLCVPGDCIHVVDATGRAVAGPDSIGMPAVPSRLTA